MMSESKLCLVEIDKTPQKSYREAGIDASVYWELLESEWRTEEESKMNGN